MPAEAPAQGIAAARLEAAARRILEGLGAGAAEAQAVAEDLVAADLEGLGSHGVMLLPMYARRLAAGSVAGHGQGHVVSDRGVAMVLDGGNALGQPVARHAADLAAARAREQGAGIVAVRNIFHFGAARLYARRMAAQGCIGIVSCNTRPLMPAPGGAEPLTGNNPLAIAAPAQGDIFPEVDMALSASAMGRIRLAEAAGEAIPEGWAADAQGRPTTDPAAAIAGMLLPAAGAKGFGLAFMLDLLCGGLSDGAIGAEVGPLYGDPARPYASSALFMAIDTGHFVASDRVAARAAGELARASASRPAPGVAQVHGPGARGAARRAASAGHVTLPAGTITALDEAARLAGVKLDLPV